MNDILSLKSFLIHINLDVTIIPPTQIIRQMTRLRSYLRYRNNDTGSGAEPNEFSIPQPANPTNPQLPIIQCPTLGAIGATDPYISRY